MIPQKAQRGDVIQFSIEGGGLVVRRLRKPNHGESLPEARSGQKDGDSLLAWVAMMTRAYPVHISDFSGSLGDGRVLLVLQRCQACRPGSTAAELNTYGS